MKKLMCIVLLTIMAFSLTSCKTEYVISNEAYIKNEHESLICRCQASYDKAIELYFKQYPTDETVIYIPQSGDYKTITGKKFTAEIDDTVQIIFMEDTYYSRLTFNIKVYDESGELIISKERFCSYVQEGTKLPDLTYVSEDFREYWLAMSIRSDKLKR